MPFGYLIRCADNFLHGLPQRSVGSPVQPHYAMTAPLFPLFTDLRHRPVLVVGGGAVAQRKITALREAGAEVRVGAPHLTPTLAAWAAQGLIAHLQGEFLPEWLDDV